MSDDSRDLAALKSCVARCFGDSDVARAACDYLDRLVSTASRSELLMARIAQLEGENSELRGQMISLRRDKSRAIESHDLLYRRFVLMASDKILSKDGLPIHEGDVLSASTGRRWRILRPCGKYDYELLGETVDSDDPKTLPLKASALSFIGSEDCPLPLVEG